MKTRRAKVHLNALERAIETWQQGKPHLIIEKDDLEKAWHYYWIRAALIPEEIPMLAGDFVCCLRSALDQLAWNLVHLDAARTFTPREERQISFLVFPCNDSTYADRRKLFPSAVADVLDSLQPYQRGGAYRDDPLWQLNELWTLDKHRTVPANCHELRITFPVQIEWERQARLLDDYVVVRVPLAQVWLSPVDIKPQVSVQILFGEYMGAFEVSLARLGEIYEVVTNSVIPRFAGFFS